MLRCLSKLVHQAVKVKAEVNAAGMSYELASLGDRNISLRIECGPGLILGRQAQLGVTNRNVSREHCVLVCSKTADAQNPRITATAQKKCYVSAGSHEKHIKLLPGHSVEVRYSGLVPCMLCSNVSEQQLSGQECHRYCHLKNGEHALRVQLSVDDVIYLSNESGILGTGFKLQRRNESTPSKHLSTAVCCNILMPVGSWGQRCSPVKLSLTAP